MLVECQQAFRAIKKANSILLVAHNRPDGDAVSSLCAMSEYLISLNKNFTPFCVDEPPYQFNFLPHFEKIKSNKEKLNFSKFDLIITLDCGSKSRTSLVDEINHKNDRQIIIEIDHHPIIEKYSNIEIRNTKLSSTTEVLYNFYKINKIKIGKKIANCILAGILTDTANLLYEATSEKTIKIASEMLVCGAQFPTILEGTWRNKSLAAMKLWGIAMSNLQINKKYNFAISVLTKADMVKTGASKEELEGIPGFLTNLKNINGLLLLREEEQGTLKGSLRTADAHVDISNLARILGGGGHPRASSFVADSTLKKYGNNWSVE